MKVTPYYVVLDDENVRLNFYNLNRFGINLNKDVQSVFLKQL